MLTDETEDGVRQERSGPRRVADVHHPSRPHVVSVHEFAEIPILREKDTTLRHGKLSHLGIWHTR